MLFPEEDAPLLKAWIVKRIENTSDADSDVLAEYVIALLKHDGDREAVRKLCEEEIPDFLTEDPKAFLDDVFQAITYKSYVAGAPPPPTKQTQGRQTQRPQPISSGEVPSVRDSNAFSPPKGPQKRGFHDRGESDAPNGQEMQAGGGRPMKQPRRGGRRNWMDNMRDPRQGGFPPPFDMPPFDPNNPLEAMMQMQAMGLPFPGMPDQFGRGFPGGGNQQHRRRPCPDFETKGYCSRGSTCTYDHGNESIFLPNMMEQGDEYDPNDAAIAVSGSSNGTAPFSRYPESGRGRGGRRRGRAGKRGGGRAPFSADGPVHDRTKSTIVVENIPEEHFDENQVRGFFSQFGNIVEVSMQPYKHLAVVKYDVWKAANDAYRSPKVIFDNRFVKVFWYKDGAEGLAPSMPRNNTNGSSFNGKVEMEDAEPDAEFDREEFDKRQEEAQKQHQEREAKKTEIEQKRQELQKQQEDLISKHQEEAERLRAKLMRKSSGDSSSGSSNMEKLRSQLAMLEDQCKIYGIDPENPDDGGTHSPGGGYRGRGGSNRGRGYMPRRGAFRGQEGRHAAYAQYSLDNRPRKLAITGVDFTSSEKDEILRHFLLNMGEFEAVVTSPDVTSVSFRDRKTAEKFYYTLHGKELHGVEGRLELAWVDGGPPPPPTAAAASAAAATKDAGADDAMGGVDAGGEQEEGEVREERPAPQPAPQRQINMDYEVEDEDGWME